MSSTFKSASASIVLHALVIVVGSLAFYNSHQTLELTGNAGGGGSRKISLSGINFSSKKSVATTAPVKPVSKAVEKTVSRTKPADVQPTTTVDSVSVTNGAVSAAVTGGTGNGSGSGSGDGSGSGSGTADFDSGYVFGKIKNFFETRLGSTLNIRENQLIKIKVTLNKEGDILDAKLVQGQLEMSALRRIISVAKNIPLKSFWKAGSFPTELIIPLVLIPS